MDVFESELNRQCGIVLTTVVSNNDTESVYEAEISHQNRHPCLVKAQWGDHMGATRREIEALRYLQHPNIMECYKSFCFSYQHWNCFVLVTESVHTTLNTEIANRRRYSYPWTEAEFTSALYQLVSAFSYMEQCRCAHFNISPETIYVVGQTKTLKVGSLEATMTVPCSGLHSLMGDFHFFSPILKSAFRCRQSEASHNPYKSGVYALGVTLVGMSVGESKPVEPAEGWQRFVWTLHWSEGVRGLLAWMLTEEESSRPSFVDVGKWIGVLHSQPIAYFPRQIQPEEPTLPAVFPPSQVAIDVEDSTVDRGFRPDQSGIHPEVAENDQESFESDLQSALDDLEEGASQLAENEGEAEAPVPRQRSNCSLF